MGDPPLHLRFAPPSPEGARVLLVDDNALALQEIGETLERIGYEVLRANTWTLALRLFHEHDVDLVVMDAVMPTVDGFRLTQILRAQAASYTPIIFLTGLQDSRARARGLSAGADDFLSKPVDTFELRVRLTAMLRIRQLTRALEDKSRALSRLAHVDALTGLGNRRSFEAELAREVERARRFEHDLSIVMIDLDHFKLINDRHGHAVGDQVLASFGEMVRDLLRTSDCAFRYGGEEFVIIAPETSATKAVTLAERIRLTFTERTRTASVCGPCTLSAGIGSLHPIEDSEPATTLLLRADQAVYRAKRDGRDRVEVFDPQDPRQRAA